MRDLLFEMTISLIVVIGSGYVIIDKNQSDQIKTVAFGAIMGVVGYFVPSPTRKIGESGKDEEENEPKDK